MSSGPEGVEKPEPPSTEVGWWTVTALAVIFLGAVPTGVAGQGGEDTQLYLRGGVWSPVGAIEVGEGTAEVALSRTLTFGLVMEYSLEPRLAMRVGFDGGLTRPVARLIGSECDLEQARGSVGSDCRWRDAPRGWLVQGALDVVGRRDGFHAGVGLGPRLLILPSFDCQLIATGCLSAQEGARQPTVTMGLRAVAGVRQVWRGREVGLHAGNSTSRLDGRFHSEVIVAVEVSLGAGDGG